MGGEEYKTTEPTNQYQGEQARPKPHIIYELEQKKEYLIRQLMDVQKAIDAVVNTLY